MPLRHGEAFGVRLSFLALFHDSGAKFATPLRHGEAFGVRLSFLALFRTRYCSWAAVISRDAANPKAAEKTAALHDAGARFVTPLRIGEAFGVRLSFLALFHDAVLFLRGSSITRRCQSKSG